MLHLTLFSNTITLKFDTGFSTESVINTKCNFMKNFYILDIIFSDFVPFCKTDC